MRKTKNLRRRPYNTSDRKLREAIFRRYADADIGGIVQVEAMELIFNWIKTGDTPAKAKEKRPKLVASNP